MNNKHRRFSTKTEFTSSEYSGLIIEQIWHSALDGLKAVKVTHKSIPNFEARALVDEKLPIADIFSEVVQRVRIQVL